MLLCSRESLPVEKLLELSSWTFNEANEYSSRTKTATRIIPLSIRLVKRSERGGPLAMHHNVVTTYDSAFEFRFRADVLPAFYQAKLCFDRIRPGRFIQPDWYCQPAIAGPLTVIARQRK